MPWSPPKAVLRHCWNSSGCWSLGSSLGFFFRSSLGFFFRLAAVAVYYKLQQSDIFRHICHTFCPTLDIFPSSLHVSLHRTSSWSVYAAYHSADHPWSFSDQLLVSSYTSYTRLADKYQCSLEGLIYFLEEASFGLPYPEYPQPYDLYSDYQ